MPDLNFGDESEVAQAFGLNPSTVSAVAGNTGLAQVTAPNLLQQISQLGAGTAIGGGQGVGGMNFSMLGSGVNDFFQAAGAGHEATSYAMAATLASQEAEFTKESTAVQNAQASRQVMMTIGTQKAGVGATGFTQSGSALQLLRSSAQQAALGHQMITLQGGINEAAYKEQAQAYTQMKEAAYNAQNGDIAGGILNTVLGVIGL